MTQQREKDDKKIHSCLLDLDEGLLATASDLAPDGFSPKFISVEGYLMEFR